jgi:uncharacterized protein YqeY
MGLFDEISSQMKDAMRAKDKARLGALRGIRAAFLTATKEDGSDELSDEVCNTLLRRLEKQRQESIEAFHAGGREEMAAAERAELAVIQEFLPRLADESTTREWVRQAIDETGASSPREVGRVMGALMKAHKGELDGSLANQIARELLES